MIARVTPEHKARLVDLLKRDGQVVAMTGDGVNDAPALKRADIGIAMGTGTEVAKQAAVMVLADDNFAAIIKAVEVGRGLYDNLVRYIRFEMGCMFGFIITFLGASLFDIARGEPLVPLQVLWVAFTTVTIQSIGLGYSRPAEGLMERPPRSPGRADAEPGGARLACRHRAGHGHRHAERGELGGGEHGLGARGPWAWCVLAVQPVLLDRARDVRESAFSLRTFADRTFLMTPGYPLLIIMATWCTVPGDAQDNPLDQHQWLLCRASRCRRAGQRDQEGGAARPPAAILDPGRLHAAQLALELLDLVADAGGRLELQLRGGRVHLLGELLISATRSPRCLAPGQRRSPAPRPRRGHGRTGRGPGTCRGTADGRRRRAAPACRRPRG